MYSRDEFAGRACQRQYVHGARAAVHQRPRDGIRRAAGRHHVIHQQHSLPFDQTRGANAKRLFQRACPLTSRHPGAMSFRMPNASETSRVHAQATDYRKFARDNFGLVEGAFGQPVRVQRDGKDRFNLLALVEINKSRSQQFTQAWRNLRTILQPEHAFTNRPFVNATSASTTIRSATRAARSGCWPTCGRSTTAPCPTPGWASWWLSCSISAAPSRGNDPVTLPSLSCKARRRTGKEVA